MDVATSTSPPPFTFNSLYTAIGSRGHLSHVFLTGYDDVQEEVCWVVMFLT